MRRSVALFALLLTGCGRYSTFTLPAPEPAGPKDPFTWHAESHPVIERGSASDVLNPSVVRFRNQYWNLYSEYDGSAWHTALATSADGVAYTKTGRVLSPESGGYIAANGSALVVGNEIRYWYESGYPLRIDLARSGDGRAWTKAGTVLPLGPYGSFDERAVADPYVVQTHGEFYLYYLGQDRAGRQRLGVARSHDGIAWEKLTTNPVLESEENLGEPAVWSSGGVWWMLFTARTIDEHRYLGLARSSDGVAWRRVPDFKIEGAESWDNQVVCDPTVELRDDGTVRVWFGGGDVARPDQGLHGQIGVGTLREN